MTTPRQAASPESGDAEIAVLADEVEVRSDDIARALTELASLLVSEESVETTLHRVADLAKATIPGCDAAGVTVVDRGSYLTVAWTDGRTLAVDEAQYARDNGPCLEAMRRKQILRTDIDTAARHWPDFAAKAREAGIEGFLAAPLVLNGEAIGALNLYSSDPYGFERLDDMLIAMFTGQATVALANARLYAEALTVSRQLEQAIVSRAPIEQAKGILMARHGYSEDEAFAALRRMSQQRNVKLRDLAAELVSSAREAAGGRPRPPNG